MCAKRGQITIFITIGIVLLIVFGSLFYVSGLVRKSQLELGQQGLSSSETSSIKAYAQSCIEQTLKDSMAQAGITNYTSLEEHFNAHLNDCTAGFKDFPGLSISQGAVSSHFIASDNGNQILGDIQLPIIINNRDSNYTISDFRISYDLASQTSLQLQNGVTSAEAEIDSKDGKSKLMIPINTHIIQKDGTAVSNISVLMKKTEKNNLTQLEYDFQPEGLVFDPPITLEFTYDDKDNDGIVDGTTIKEDELVISYKAYPYLYVNIPTSIDKSGNKITAQISHFSTYKISSRSLAGVGIANVYLIDPITTPQAIAVELSDLDGSGYLRSKYVDIKNIKYESDIPTERVMKPDLNFTYNPAPFGQAGYWGNDDVSDAGHRFDQVAVYFAINNAGRFFHDRFGFQPQQAVVVGLYDIESDIGHYTGDYNIIGTMPKQGENDWMRDVRGNVHEYTHLVQGELSDLPYSSLDEQALVESFAKYFECAFTNASYDPYVFNPETGIKDFSDYGKWQYGEDSGKNIAFILASAWWHVRQELGDKTTDMLVYEAMKYAKYESCAASDALRATLRADDAMNAGKNKVRIITIFHKHNIYLDKCYPDTG